MPMENRRCRAAGAIAAALALAACAATRRETLVVVVPENGGKVGTVAVSTPAGEAVLDSPYAAATSGPGAAPQKQTLSDAEVKSTFAAALSARPERPLSFTLYFLGDSDELTPASRQHLQEVLVELRRRGAAEVTVVGHTDRLGAIDYNDRLSLQRARRVVAELVGIGIPETSIAAAGRGEREPLIVTEDEVAEPRNRRVEVSVR